MDPVDPPGLHAELLTRVHAGEGQRFRCIGCRACAVSIDGLMINPGPGTIIGVCLPQGLRAAHGPWLPEDIADRIAP
jgi:hypothetical protein